MEKFKTAYGVYKNTPTPAGCDIMPEFGYVKKQVDDFDANGKKTGSHDEIVFGVVGKHSITEEINSYRSTTEIKEIMKRYAAGDMSILTKRVGEFIDTLGCPDNLLDAQLMLKNGEKLFSQIPSDIREKYDNDVGKFLQAAMSGKLGDDFDLSKQAADDLSKTQKNEIDELRKQIAELQKGGVDYE